MTSSYLFSAARLLLVNFLSFTLFFPKPYTSLIAASLVVLCSFMSVFSFSPFVTVRILEKQKNKIQLQITLSFGRNISKCVIISIGVWCKYCNVIASRLFSRNYHCSIVRVKRDHRNKFSNLRWL